MDSFDIDQRHISYNVHMQSPDLFLDNKRYSLKNMLHSCFLYFLRIGNIFLPDLHLALPHIHGHNIFQVYIKSFLFDDSLNFPFPLIPSTPSQLFDNTQHFSLFLLYFHSYIFPLNRKVQAHFLFPLPAHKARHLLPHPVLQVPIHKNFF